MLLVLFVVMIFANYFISRTLFRPFHNTLKKINHYKISDCEVFEFEKTKTYEFNRLNHVLRSMSEKIQHDYKNLKEFTENASHEILTPLSIIKAEIENLIQSENLSAQQAQSMLEINKATTRLSKLNSGLLIISKIESNQYTGISEVDICLLLENSLEVLKDFIQHKNLVIEKHFNNKLVIQANPALIELMIGNLINNAIKHNFENGIITITTYNNSLEIKNTGYPLNKKPEEFFNRFVKNSEKTESLGLGLSIVKKICDFNEFKISYTYEKEVHTIKVTVNSSMPK
jgi:signal transduction histidine kinase